MRLLLPALVVTAAAAFAAPQSSGPSLKIVAPTADTYLSGQARLVAVVEPGSASRTVKSVTFFADGRQVCVVAHPPYECDWDAGEGLSEHSIRVVAAVATGGTLVDTVRTQSLAHTEVVQVDVVQLTAVVTDSDGRFVRDLPRTAFRVFEDGKPQAITAFTSENIPLELVTALDVSASMTEALPGVKDAAKRFLRGLRPADKAAVISFNDVAFTVARSSVDQAGRERAIDRMAPWGSTALYDAIIMSLNVLGRQTGRRAVVLFSDGEDESSHASLDAVVARAEASDATIYAIGQGSAIRKGSLRQVLTKLAHVSGGRAFFTENKEQLDSYFEEIQEDLRNQYVISYPARRDGAYHAIRVEAGDGKYKVRTRPGYRLTSR